MFRGTRMMLSLFVAVGTWALSLVLRAWAQAYTQAVENARGPAFPPWGFLHGAQTQLLLVSIAMVFVVVLLYWLARPTGRLAAIGLGLFAGGAIGNTTERLFFGGIIDYIPIPWPEPYLANAADLTIVAGYILLIASLIHQLIARAWSLRQKPHV
jgi:lipoprotein signal peptidase